MFVFFSFKCWVIFRSFVKISPRYFIFFLTAYVLLPAIIFELPVLLFLLLNISTPLFYNLFSNALLHAYSSTVSIFFNWSMSELVMVMSSISNSDNIIRCSYFIPSPSAQSSTSCSSTSDWNSGPYSTFTCLIPFSNSISFVGPYLVFIVVTWSWHKLYISLHILPLTPLCHRL